MNRKLSAAPVESHDHSPIFQNWANYQIYGQTTEGEAGSPVEDCSATASVHSSDFTSPSQSNRAIHPNKCSPEKEEYPYDISRATGYKIMSWHQHLGPKIPSMPHVLEGALEARWWMESGFTLSYYRSSVFVHPPWGHPPSSWVHNLDEYELGESYVGCLTSGIRALC